MGKTWANFGTDLHLDLPAGGTSGVRAALIRALRDAVRTGRLAPGTRLPSSRSLAADLGLARNTVADAYAELVAEGWLTARQGSGTRVARRANPARTAGRTGMARTGMAGTAAHRTAGTAADRATARTAADRTEAGRTEAGRTEAGRTEAGRTEAGRTEAGRTEAGRGGGPVPAPRPAVHNLFPGSPDAASFPRAAWLAAARRALTAAPSEAFGYGEPRGRPELRRALAGYLARARGVLTDPEQIVVCSGFVHGLRLLAEVLRRAGTRTMAVESYGLDVHRRIVARAGLRTPPLAVDERGARTDGLAGLPDAGAVLLTPAHQFPTGVPLHPDRRAAVVDWARRTGGLVIEDDYDGEFRYDRQPVGALQGLDPERVAYVGTVSKSLSPGLRLGWMVLPEELVAPVAAAKGEIEWQASTLDQLTLAEFIESGAYDRHVRGMRLRYRRRRDHLVAALAEHAPHIRVTGIAAGLHAVLELPAGTEQSVISSAAAWHGLALDGMSRYRHEAAAPGPLAPVAPVASVASVDPDGSESESADDALVVGYGTPPEHAFSGAIDALCRALP
ncbi:aminotransferase-like domain-containing protein [Streptomyces sp. 8N616]|uniref:aminotransferase-like domain-containing protein n=1 Tax=Streptomyces sp. 8N616 TaxID=3457414 RepID=UPI003FD098BC